MLVLGIPSCMLQRFIADIVLQHQAGCVMCRMEVITPKEYVGTLMELCQGRRGEFIDMQFLTETRTTLIYELPLANVRSLATPLTGVVVSCNMAAYSQLFQGVRCCSRAPPPPFTQASRPNRLLQCHACYW